MAHTGIVQAILIGIFVAFVWAVLSNGIDRQILNQDTMLCESAKVSGNTKYLNKCQCYYQTQEIKCLQTK